MRTASESWRFLHARQKARLAYVACCIKRGRWRCNRDRTGACCWLPRTDVDSAATVGGGMNNSAYASCVDQTHMCI